VVVVAFDLLTMTDVAVPLFSNVVFAVVAFLSHQFDFLALFV
jgi:hypothetical protein